MDTILTIAQIAGYSTLGFIIWVAVSLPVSMFIGRCIKRGMGETEN